MQHTDAAREKMRRAWEKRRANFIPPMKGKKMSDASRKKMSESAKKRPSNRLGKRHSVASRIKISQHTRERTPRGERCHSYKDGKLAERRDQRFSRDYKRWRFDVFARDHFTCCQCGDNRGGNLVAHHIKPFADYPELRFDVSNGMTLCKTCHDKLHRAS